MIKSNVIWSSIETCKAVYGECDVFWQATGVSIDSRTIKPGDLFIAIKDSQYNGHDYVEEAFEKGAVAAIVSKSYIGSSKNLVFVDDTLQALQDLAKVSRLRTNAKVIAIFDDDKESNIQEYFKTVLPNFGQLHAIEESQYSEHYLMLSLASMHAGTDYCVINVRANEVDCRISDVIQADISIIQDAETSYSEYVCSGFALVGQQNRYLHDCLEKEAKSELTIYSYGEGEDLDATLHSFLQAANGSRSKACIMGRDVNYSLQVNSKSAALNALPVLLAVKLLGLDMFDAAKSLAKQEAILGLRNREHIDAGEPCNPVTLIDTGHHTSTASMKAAFKVLALIDPGRGGRRIAILGDMLALGKESDKTHEELALPLKASGVDLVYTCGKKARKLQEDLPEKQKGYHAVDSKELAHIVPDVLIPGDVVMVKGSVESKMNLVVEALRALPAKFKKATSGK